MSGEINIPIVGNLTDTPTRNTTNTGRTVANFTIASTSRTYDHQTGQYKDGNTVYMRCNAWGPLAEHILATCTKGMRVVAVGELRQHVYQDAAGSKHTATDMTVTELGPSLRYATAQVTKTTNNNGFAGGNGYGNPANGPAPQNGYSNPYAQNNNYTPQFNDPYDPASQYQQQTRKQPAAPAQPVTIDPQQPADPDQPEF